MRDGTRIDDEGFHVFALDPAKHDPFDVLARLMAACDATPGALVRDDAPSATRFARIMAERERERREAKSKR